MTTTYREGAMRFNYCRKYGPLSYGLDGPFVLVVMVYDYDGRFSAGSRS